MTFMQTRTLGNVGTADSSVATPSAQYMMPSGAMLSAMTRQFAPLILGADATPAGFVDPAVDEKCGCLVEQLVAAAPTVPPPEVALQVHEACRLNPDQLEQTLAAQGISVDACKPWYARKTTMIAGGVAAAGLAAYFLLR